MNSFRPTSRSWTPSASSLMWATGMSPFLSDSSTIAARISCGILSPGAATSLIHIFVKWTPRAACSRTIARASSPVVGVFVKPELNPSGYEKPSPAVNARGRSGRPAFASRHQGHLLRVVRADAPGRRHAVVELCPKRLLRGLDGTAVVGVQIDQPGNDRLAGGVDDLRAVRHRDGVARAGRADAAAIDQDDRVGDRVGAGAVDELGADDRQVGRLGVGSGGAASRQQGDRQERKDWKSSVSWHGAGRLPVGLSRRGHRSAFGAPAFVELAALLGAPAPPPASAEGGRPNAPRSGDPKSSGSRQGRASLLSRRAGRQLLRGRHWLQGKADVSLITPVRVE